MTQTSLDNEQSQFDASMEARAAINLFGTLEIEGDGIYYLFANQTNTRVTWTITARDIFENKSADAVVALLRIKSTGLMEGKGKTYLLTRFLDNLSTMVGKAAQHNNVQAGFLVQGNYVDESGNGDFINFTTFQSGRKYSKLEMSYEGFRVSLDRYMRPFPFKVPTALSPVVDDKTQSAMIAGLGVRTFSILRRSHNLDWYDKKDYKLITSNEEFRQMMVAFLDAVQDAADNNKAVLLGLDTETTGLNMLKLEPNNPVRDYIVAIPFSWEDNKGYVICTEMYYFGNVEGEEIYPLFDMLFSRNDDYTYQDIELDYEGKHYSFNRKNIMIVGANAGFDERAFFCHDAHVFFDEDIQIMHYLLATDWVQGKNSLKYMTHRYLGDETLELEDLFGPAHKDKYRYLSDPEIALVYGGADGDYTRALWKKLRPLIPDNLYYLYKKYDITTLYRVSDATWHGMYIDERKVREQGNRVLQDLETLKNFIYKYAYAANRNNLEEKSDRLCELLGLSTTDEVIGRGQEEGMYRYPFTPANHKHLLFNILGYPVLQTSEKSQEPTLNKFVLKKLAAQKRETPVDFLKEDIPSAEDPDNPLIKKDEFNSLMYPLASVFITYAKLNKEYTAYYKPIMDNDLESRMFYTFSLQRAATRRILSAGQTMKGSLKKLVIAPPGKLFLCFDASQIEYRHMASLAYIQTKHLMQQEHPDDWEQRLADSGIARIHRMMQNAEADYHIETASMMTGLPQYQIDSDTRRMYKSIGFGIPYGLGDQSMCESLFGRVTSENMVKTKEVLADYKARQFEIIRLLETVRDSAFVPAKIHPEFREMLDIGDTHVGIVKNFTGFYRLFILENLTRAKSGRIRRQAGNCIIQGGAAELFRRMIYNFYMGCAKAGIHKQVQWLMLVHDEVDSLVDANIDVLKVLEVLQQGCTLRYEDHIPYYIGIGFGRNWKSAKDDTAELPVIMVNRLIEGYHNGYTIPCDGNQPDNLLKLKRHYMCDRVGEVLSEIIPEIGPGFQWSDKATDIVSDAFTNYVVRAYLSVFTTPEDKAQYGKSIPLQVQLQRWQEAREQYGFGNDFLTEKFQDAREGVAELVFGDEPEDFVIDVDAESLDIELLSNDEEDNGEEKPGASEAEQGQWFGEDDLFDYSISSEELLSENSESTYKFLREERENEESEYVVNDNPTSAFDVFVSQHYTRSVVFQSSDTMYTVMLGTTPYNRNLQAVVNVIRESFGTGTDTILLIGSEIRKVTNIQCTPEKLDQLDKALTGYTDKAKEEK